MIKPSNTKIKHLHVGKSIKQILLFNKKFDRVRTPNYFITSIIFSMIILGLSFIPLDVEGLSVLPIQEKTPNDDSMDWEIIFLRTRGDCIQKNWQALGHYAYTTIQYLEMYKIKNALTGAHCISVDKSYAIIDKAVATSDLTIIIPDLLLSFIQNYKTDTLGHFSWYGDGNDKTIVSQTTNFLKIEDKFATWTLSHELSHFALQWKGYSRNTHAEAVHLVEKNYQICKNDDVSLAMCTRLWDTVNTTKGKNFPVMSPSYTENIAKQMDLRSLPKSKEVPPTTPPKQTESTPQPQPKQTVVNPHCDIDADGNVIATYGKITLSSPNCSGLSQPNSDVLDPLNRLSMINPNLVDPKNVDKTLLSPIDISQKISFAVTVQNNQDREQSAFFIVNVKDVDKDKSVFLETTTNSFPAGFYGTQILSTLVPDSTGTYLAEIFVWESVDNPTAISSPLNIGFQVVENQQTKTSVEQIANINYKEQAYSEKDYYKNQIEQLTEEINTVEHSLTGLVYQNKDAQKKIEQGWDKRWQALLTLKSIKEQWEHGVIMLGKEDYVESYHIFNEIKSMSKSIESDLRWINASINDAKKMEKEYQAKHEIKNQDNKKSCFLFWCW